MSIIQHFPCVLSVCSTVCFWGGKPQHLREKKKKKGRRKQEKSRKKGVRLQTAFDICPNRLGLSLLSSSCAAVRSRHGNGRRTGLFPGLKVGGVRAEGSAVSPGSLCRSPVPAGCSCSSSSPSAGCTAARWCLRQTDKKTWLLRSPALLLKHGGGRGEASPVGSRFLASRR